MQRPRGRSQFVGGRRQARLGLIVVCPVVPLTPQNFARTLQTGRTVTGRVRTAPLGSSFEGRGGQRGVQALPATASANQRTTKTGRQAQLKTAECSRKRNAWTRTHAPIHARARTHTHTPGSTCPQFVPSLTRCLAAGNRNAAGGCTPAPGTSCEFSVHHGRFQAAPRWR